MTAEPRIAFLFKSGRKQRDLERHPSEFFYGLPQLRAAGWRVALIDQGELGLNAKPRRVWRGVNELSHVATGVPLWALWRLARSASRAKLANYDMLVATTNTFGVCLSLLRRIGLLRGKILFIAMGLCDLATPPRLWSVYRALLHGTVLLSLSRSEQEFLAERFGAGISVEYLPFGVDHRFWTPSTDDGEGDYVLSIGNDRHRDYRTLLAAWKPNYPRLRIVTRQPIKINATNIEIVHGDWNEQTLSDAAIRDLFRRARLVVLPIRATMQPSGQSTCLQAMACGKAVVLSDIPGLWDRQRMVGESTCVLVPPADIAALQDAVEHLLADPDRARLIGRAARRQVDEHFNADVMAAALETILNRVTKQVA